MTDPVTTVDTDHVTLTPEQLKEQLDLAIERLDKHAESQLEMARLFISHGKTEIARRRLQEILELYAKSDAAKEARLLLKRM
jgi:Tfp pilus assembly protein FimV